MFSFFARTRVVNVDPDTTAHDHTQNRILTAKLDAAEQHITILQESRNSAMNEVECLRAQVAILLARNETLAASVQNIAMDALSTNSRLVQEYIRPDVPPVVTHYTEDQFAVRDQYVTANELIEQDLATLEKELGLIPQKGDAQ